MVARPDEFVREIEDALADAERIVGGDEDRTRVLGPHLKRIIRALSAARGACLAVANGNPRAAAGAFRAFGGAVNEVASGLETELSSQEAMAIAAQEEVAQLQNRIKTLERARAELEQAIVRERARADQVVTARDQRILELETIAITSADTVIQQLTAFVRAIPPKLDAALREIDIVANKLGRLLGDDVEKIGSLEEIEVEEISQPGAVTHARRPLPDEIAALGSAVAVFRGRRYYDFTDADRAAAARIVARYDALQRQYGELIELLSALQKERNDIEEERRRCAEQWTNADRDLRSALHLFPLVFKQDPFALANTTQETVSKKRVLYGRQQQRCAECVTDIDRILHERQLRYEAISRSLEPIRREIAELQAFNDIPWYEALAPEEQRMLRAVVLTFRNDDRHLSRKTITGILALAGIIPAAEDAETFVGSALRDEFFAPAAVPKLQNKMFLYRLTPLADHWRMVWVRTDPELAVTVETAREMYAQQAVETETQRSAERARRTEEARQKRIAKEAARERAKAQREAIVAARRAATENPTSILERLRPLDRQILAVYGVIDAMEIVPSRDEAKFLAAAVTAGILLVTRVGSLPVARRRLQRFRPPLLIATDETGEMSGLITSAARGVVALLPRLRDAQIATLEGWITTKVQCWSEKNHALYHRIREILGAASTTS